MSVDYAARLRLEGAVLAAAGTVASGLLIARVPASRRWPANTIGQVGLVAAALLLRGPAQVDTWMAAAEPVAGPEPGGEPTPLLHVPVPMVAAALLFRGLGSVGGPLRPLTAKAGWDAALRVTAGSGVVGAVQALVLARHVAAAEAREGRTYFRVPGSRLGRGTVLGYVAR